MIIFWLKQWHNFGEKLGTVISEKCGFFFDKKYPRVQTSRDTDNSRTNMSVATVRSNVAPIRDPYGNDTSLLYQSRYEIERRVRR